MREFILYSRLGRTDANWVSLHDAGRLDIVYECVVASLFLSHGIRRDVVFHAVLGGPPNPPLCLKVDGASLRDVRTDQETWKHVLKKVLSGKAHPGVSVERLSFEALLRVKAEVEKARVYVLEEGGKDVSEIEFADNVVFVLGDHVGLPRKVEGYALRYGEKVSLGRTPYLAASCITVLNYLMDRCGKSKSAQNRG